MVILSYVLASQTRELGERGKKVVRALASRGCGPGSILSLDHMWVNFLLVLSLLQEVFPWVLRFPLSSKTSTSKFQFDQMQDLPENHFRVSGAS